MAIDLNLSGVERPKYELLPEGEYTLVLTDLKVKPGKNDASKVIAHCTYEVVEPDEYSGRKLLYWQTLNDRDNAGYTKIWIEALMGEPVSDDISVDEDELVGRHVTAFVKHQPDNRDNTKMQATISYFILPFDTTE